MIWTHLKECWTQSKILLMVSPQNPRSQWMSISVPTIIAPKHTQSFTYTCLLVLISPKDYHDIYRNQVQRHSHIMVWLGVAGVQADFRICPHILTLTEWLVKLTVNRTNHNLSWEQLGRNTQVRQFNIYHLQQGLYKPLVTIYIWWVSAYIEIDGYFIKTIFFSVNALSRLIGVGASCVVPWPCVSTLVSEPDMDRTRERRNPPPMPGL